MASCINSLSRLFDPKPRILKTKFARTQNISTKPFRATFVSATMAHKWTITDQDHITTSNIPDIFPLDYDREIEDVKQLLFRSTGKDDPVECLVLVDTIQRLGISFYFHEEIETIIEQQYLATTPTVYGSYTLHKFSLFFRLSRQHGHYISADVFNNFKDNNGQFRSQDIKGLMELYEASQLSFHGEYILDEAAFFSTKLLSNKLRYPYHKSIPRLTEKDLFLRDFKSTYEWENRIRELALMDLHKRQIVYKDELLQVSKWWNELGLAKNLRLARNQPLKWYTWSMTAFLDDISLSVQRVELTKSIAFIYLIDDIFDLYGTLDELTVFTEAVNKWDYDATNTLPEYMKMCYMALLDVTHEISHKIYKMHGYNPINSLKTTWANLCNAYLVEAKWFASNDLPSANKYLDNGKVSSGVYVTLAHVFFLLGLGRGSIHLNDTSKLVSSVAIILRLWNDLGSAKDEQQDEKDGPYIECYRKEHLGLLPLEQAREHVVDMIADEWKTLNEECFRLNQTEASSFKRASLNVARIVSLMYGYDDNQRLPVLEEYVEFMLFNETT